MVSQRCLQAQLGPLLDLLLHAKSGDQGMLLKSFTVLDCVKWNLDGEASGEWRRAQELALPLLDVLKGKVGNLAIETRAFEVRAVATELSKSKSFLRKI